MLSRSRSASPTPASRSSPPHRRRPPPPPGRRTPTRSTHRRQSRSRIQGDDPGALRRPARHGQLGQMLNLHTSAGSALYDGFSTSARAVHRRGPRGRCAPSADIPAEHPARVHRLQRGERPRRGGQRRPPPDFQPCGGRARRRPTRTTTPRPKSNALAARASARARGRRTPFRASGARLQRRRRVHAQLGGPPTSSVPARPRVCLARARCGRPRRGRRDGDAATSARATTSS